MQPQSFKLVAETFIYNISCSTSGAPSGIPRSFSHLLAFHQNPVQTTPHSNLVKAMLRAYLATLIGACQRRKNDLGRDPLWNLVVKFIL
jgi:hypothetical protein